MGQATAIAGGAGVDYMGQATAIAGGAGVDYMGQAMTTWVRL